MWKTYGEVAKRHPKLLPLEERCMIARAQAGSKRIRDKLVFHHIGFIMWRLRKKVFPDCLKRHGDDILSAAILELYRKVETYNLEYRDRKGKLKPVRFASYVGKRIDGLAIDYIKHEKGGVKRQKPLLRESRKRLLCGQEACVI